MSSDLSQPRAWPALRSMGMSMTPKRVNRGSIHWEMGCSLSTLLWKAFTLGTSARISPWLFTVSGKGQGPGSTAGLGTRTMP